MSNQYAPQHQGGYSFYANGQRVELRVHGKAVAVSGHNLVLESHNSASAVFEIKHSHEDIVEIKSEVTGHYIALDSSGNTRLHNGKHEGGDTHFHLESHGGNQVAFKSKHGHYLTVKEHGGFVGIFERGKDSTFEEILL